jgi:hypothetical protein
MPDMNFEDEVCDAIPFRLAALERQWLGVGRSVSLRWGPSCRVKSIGL